ncbi:MAG: tetratricopeptide repeat protein [Magnetococcales bacterium]|nr:tetratricopeptide repeat protein [Magnetococcales bacterium]
MTEPTSQLSLDAAYAKAIKHFNAKRYTEADQLCTAIIQAAPDHIDTINLLGVIAQKINRHDLAQKQFQRAIDIDSSRGLLYYNLGTSLYQLGQKAAAISALHTALEKEPGNRQITDYLNTIIDAGADNQECSSEEALQRAISFHHAGRVGEAIEWYNKVLETEPENSIVHANIGAALQNLGRLDEAVASYQKAISINPDSAESYSNLGVILKRDGKLDEAVSSCQKAISINPDYVEAHTNLGNVLQLQEKLDGAVASYQKALSIDPGFAKAYANLGNTLHKQEKLEEAVANLQKAISLNPNYADAYSNLGNTLKAQGELEEAAVSYQKALSINPKFAEAHCNLGNVLQEQRKLEQAVASYQKAIALNPDLADAHYNLGITLNEQGKPDEALNCYQKALEIKPGFRAAQSNYKSLLSKRVPGWHFPMMNDLARNHSYEEALKAAVQPGSIVLDIGTGAGLLSLMAARAGAERVISVEVVPAVAQIAEKIVESNGYSDVITVYNKTSKHIKVGKELPQRGDILVTEIFDVGLLGENCVDTIKHARANLLKEDALIIPQSAQVFAALLESENIYKMGKVNSVSGFDLSAFNVVSRPYLQVPLKNYPYSFLSEKFPLFHFDFTGKTVDQESKKLSINPTKNGICHGVAFWFRLDLDATHRFDSATDKSPDNHWSQAVYLFDSPLKVAISKEVKITACHNNNKFISFSLD